MASTQNVTDPHKVLPYRINHLPNILHLAEGDDDKTMQENMADEVRQESPSLQKHSKIVIKYL